MILSGVILDSFSSPTFLWLPVTHLGVASWPLVKKGVEMGQEVGLSILLPHLIMSAFGFVDELGGWF